MQPGPSSKSELFVVPRVQMSSGERWSEESSAGRFLATIQFSPTGFLVPIGKAPRNGLLCKALGKAGVGEEGGLAVPLSHMARDLLVCREAF